MKLKKFNFKIVNSTNDLAIKIIKNTKNKSGIVIAERQKKGRGQYGKKWTSFKGNLFVSIFFQAEDGILDSLTSRGLGDVYKRQSFSKVWCPFM